MGIASSEVVNERVPLVANKVLKKYDPDTTAVIYIFGEKDAGFWDFPAAYYGTFICIRSWKINRPYGARDFSISPVQPIPPFLCECSDMTGIL